MDLNNRYEVSRSSVASGDLQQQTLKSLEQVEDRIRHLQRLVMEDVPCCEILRESAVAQAEVARFERTLLVNALEQRLLQLRRCTAEAAPALLDEVLEMFSAAPTRSQQDRKLALGGEIDGHIRN